MTSDELRKKKEDAEKVGLIDEINILIEDLRPELSDCLKMMGSDELKGLIPKLRSATTRQGRIILINEAIFKSDEVRRAEEDSEDGFDGESANYIMEL